MSVVGVQTARDCEPRRGGAPRRRALFVGIVLAITVAAIGAPSVAEGATSQARPLVASATSIPPLSHVFSIVLENHSASDVTSTTGQRSMPYLTALRTQGVTLDNMNAVGHVSLGNYIAMTSGNAPNPLTSADCLSYNCIFTPPNDTNIGDQLEGANLSWKAYMQSMPAPCTHPTSSGPTDPYLVGYATRHNPFMYYQDIVGTDITTTPQRCVDHDVPYTQFATDVANNAVPNYSLIVPDTCDDAHDGGTSCGLNASDTWLANNLPQILSSAAYQNNGMVVITFDEGNLTDTAGCCGTTPGGGHIFTLVLSPNITTPGANSPVAYNHYSLLRTIEDGFGLPCLQHACDAGVQSFGSDVWGTGQTVTTGYTAAEVPWVFKVAQVFGYFPIAQKTAVYVLAWVTAVGGKPGPQPVIPPPDATGPASFTSGYGTAELPVLQYVEHYYGLTAEQVQKYAVAVSAFIFSLPPH